MMDKIFNTVCMRTKVFSA